MENGAYIGIIGTVIGAVIIIVGNLLTTHQKEQLAIKTAKWRLEEDKKSFIIKKELELLEADVEKVNEAIDAILFSLRTMNDFILTQHRLTLKMKEGIFTENEVKTKLVKLAEDKESEHKHIRKAVSEGAIRAYSLGEKVIEHYKQFEKVVGDIERLHSGETVDDQRDFFTVLTISGANLHAILRETIVEELKRQQ